MLVVLTIVLTLVHLRILQIFHDGNSKIQNSNNGCDLRIISDTVELKGNSADEMMLKAVVNNQVELYHNNSKKFETTAAGGTLSGTLSFPDGDSGTTSEGGIKLGASGDLHIYHDGNNSHIKETGTGDLIITGKNNITFLDYGTNETMAKMKSEGSVELYHDNSKKFFTHSLGVTVESTGNTPTIVFRGASSLDMGNIAVDQFSSNNSLMTFSTLSSGTQGEVLRLLDNKQILLSKTTNSSASQSGIVISANGNCQFSHNGTSDHDFLEFNRGTDGSMNRIGLIRTSGSGTIYNTTSDYRLKENAVAISDGITRLKTLKPYRFNFKIEPDKTVDGFFAHEVTAVPEAITGTKDEVDSDNKPVYQGIDHSRLIPLLTAALQEAVTKIETLETKVAALEAA